MAALLARTKTVLGLVATAAAIVGWSVVLLQDTWLDHLENTLAARDQEATGTAHKTPLAERQTELAAGKAALASLQAKINAAETALARLQTTVHQQRQRSPAPTATYQTLTRARVRAGPSTNTNEVAVVAAQQMLEVSEPVEGGTWYKVWVPGYMFHTLVQRWCTCILRFCQASRHFTAASTRSIIGKTPRSYA